MQHIAHLRLIVITMAVFILAAVLAVSWVRAEKPAAHSTGVPAAQV